MRIKKIITFLILAFVITPLFPIYAQEVPPQDQLRTTIERIIPSIVTIRMYKNASARKPIASGSGFAFTGDGYILTNKHVVYNTKAKYKVLLSDGTEKKAEVVYRDANNDVAIVKVDAPFKTIAFFGNSEDLTKGQSVTAIGNAHGKAANSYTHGTISGFNRNVVARSTKLVEKLSGLIENTTDIEPGYSGGPLIDIQGSVLGINVAKNAKGPISSYAIPIDDVKESIRTFFTDL